MVGCRRVVQGNRGAIVDRLADRVLIEVALLVIGAEDLESALAVRRLVDRRAREAEIGGVRQGAHEVVAEIATGGAVRFVDEDEDVAS